jgi:hypothetical protein
MYSPLLSSIPARPVLAVALVDPGAAGTHRDRQQSLRIEFR